MLKISRELLPIFSFAMLCIGCAAFTVYCFSPGIVDTDGLISFTQGRSNLISDSQSPMFAKLWQLFGFSRGGFPLLVAQTGLFAAGTALLAAFLHRNFFFRSILFLTLFFFPPVYSQIGVVAKDAWFLDVLILAAALLLWCQASKVAALGIIVMASGALLLRQNAFFTVVPLLLLPLTTIFPSLASRSYVRVIATCGFAVLLTLCAEAANQYVIRDNHSYPTQRTMSFDLVGLSVLTHQVLVPESLGPFTIEELNGLYSEAGNVRPLWRGIFPWLTKSPRTPHVLLCPVEDWGIERVSPPQNIRKSIPTPSDPESVAQIRHAWLTAVISHPIVYIEFRMSLWKHLWGLAPCTCAPYQDYIRHNHSFRELDLAMPSDGSRQRALVREVTQLFFDLGDSLLFRPWIFMLVLIAALPCAELLERKERSSLKAIAWSALTGQFGTALMAPSCDFRYSIWTVFAALLCTLYLLFGLKTRFSSKPHISPAIPYRNPAERE